VIRDVESGRVLTTTFSGYSLASAFVWDEALYLFGAKRTVDPDGKIRWNDVSMTKTTDLVRWSDPEVVVTQRDGEHFFNQSVCRGADEFVMAIETDNHTPFTIEFARSSDLATWERIPAALFSPDTYVACPALRYCGGAYYLLYTVRPTDRWWFEVWAARASDLRHWEVSAHNPVLAPDPNLSVYPGLDIEGPEVNNSDPDLVEWQGRTRVYFTGGCQERGGRLQYAEYDGPLCEFLGGLFQNR
jgi:alpha-L-fucosidase